MKRIMKVKLCALLTMIALCVSVLTNEVSANNTSAIYPDGIYAAEVVSSSSMFRITKAILTVIDGKMSASITLSGTGYSKLFMGTAEEAENAQGNEISFEADGDGKYVFNIPVTALNTDINVAAYSTSKSIWYDRTLNFSINTDLPADGYYSVDVWSSSSMFNIIDTVLIVDNETAQAIITLSGTGYSKLFMGTAAEAAASEENAIEYVANSEGKYTYKLPIEALNTGIYVAAYSTNKAIWYDRTLIFHGDTLESIINPKSNLELANENGEKIVDIIQEDIVENPIIPSEETKVEETKVEEAKAEETIVEEAKVEETKAEESKVEETKVEETKAEEPNNKVDKSEVGTDIQEPSVTTEVEQLPATGEASTIKTETFILLAVACAAVMAGILVKRKKQVIN